MIELDYHKDKELFNKTAEKWAKKIEKTKKSQVRNFYDEVLKLQARAKKEGFDEVLPFVKMLNSKVAYAVNRKVATKEFEKFMSECIKKIDSEEKLDIFQLFFEAVIGFYKGRD